MRISFQVSFKLSLDSGEVDEQTARRLQASVSNIAQQLVRETNGELEDYVFQGTVASYEVENRIETNCVL